MVFVMYLELDAIIADLKTRLEKEKSLKSRLLLERAVEALSDYQKQAALKH